MGYWRNNREGDSGVWSVARYRVVEIGNCTMGSREFDGEMVFLDSTLLSISLLTWYTGALSNGGIKLQVCIHRLLQSAVANDPQRQTQSKHCKPSSPVTEVPHKQWLDVSIVWISKNLSKTGLMRQSRKWSIHLWTKSSPQFMLWIRLTIQMQIRYSLSTFYRRRR